MRTLTVVLLPITTFATLLAVVACGPAKDYVTVRQQPRSVLAQAVESCQSGIKASQKSVQQFKTVKFCRIPSDSKSDRTKEQKLELKDEPYYFEVSRKSGEGKSADQLAIDLRVGLNLPVGVSKDTQALILKSLKNACTPSIRSVFSRSVRGLNLSISPEFEAVDAAVVGSESSVTPMNELDLLKSGAETEYPAFEMQAFANGAKFYPAGDAAEVKRCASVSGGKLAIRECNWKAFLSSNQKFCRQLTKMTGIWLGLSDEATERVACGKSAVEAEPAAADAGSSATEPVAGSASGSAAVAKTPVEVKKPGKSKFMTAASSEDPKKFFETAKLDLSELSTILTPACPAFATIAEPVAAVKAVVGPAAPAVPAAGDVSPTTPTSPGAPATPNAPAMPSVPSSDTSEVK